MSEFYSLYRLVWAGLMAALISVGAFISIPLPVSPVPITLQDMFLALTGLILGRKYGLLALLLYLAAGTSGLPVFSGGKGGVAVLLGPTSGYFLGFALVVLAAGWVRRRSLWLAGIVVFIATMVMLCMGAVRVGHFMDISPMQALLVGFLPFIPGSLFKVPAAIIIYKSMREHQLGPK